MNSATRIPTITPAGDCCGKTVRSIPYVWSLQCWGGWCRLFLRLVAIGLVSLGPFRAQGLGFRA